MSLSNKVLCLFLLSGVSQGVICQNLVPNPQFEEVEFCPDLSGQMEAVNDWFNINPDGSPDYFNKCFIENGLDPDPDVPLNSFGYQQSRSGDGYAGIFSYGLNVREYIQVKLINPLEEGLTYELQMYLAPGDEVAWAINSMGMFLSEEPTTGEGTFFLLEETPQVVSDPNMILNDTMGWTLVTGYYIAQGNEEYLTIGNFLPDSLTTAEALNPSGIYENQSYYYIEDVSVTMTSPVSTIDLEALEIKIFPNPVSEYLFLEFKSAVNTRYHFSIFDATQREVFRKENLSPRAHQKFDIKNLQTGVYFYQIVTPGHNRIFGKFLKL